MTDQTVEARADKRAVSVQNAAEARLELDVDETAAVAEMEAEPVETPQLTADALTAVKPPASAIVTTATTSSDSDHPRPLRLAIAANKKFFANIAPRLDGLTEPAPCPKCELPTSCSA